MKSIVLGAGVVGVTTAYHLAKKGAKVILIDQHDHAATACSSGNGGQLSYNFHNPIASPAVLKQLPKIVLNLDPAFKVYPTLNLDFYRWGIQFLKQCSAKNSSHSSAVMLQLCQLAKRHIQNTIKETDIKFDYRKRSGKVYLYPSENLQKKAFNKGNQTTLLNSEDINKLLPQVLSNRFYGVLDEEEESGDSRKFCRELIKYMETHLDVTFIPNTKLRSFNVEHNKIASIMTDQGSASADNYVVCLGAQSSDLLKPIDIHLPIYPMKGYSVTVPATESCPNLSITDTQHKTVYCKLGNRLRIASFAEFSDKSSIIRESRIQHLIDNAKRFMPDAGDYTTINETWCGLRPSTPDSIPIVEQSKYENLYLNTGHGMLGWTQSSATAHLVSQLIYKQPTDFDMTLLSSQRF